MKKTLCLFLTAVFVCTAFFCTTASAAALPKIKKIIPAASGKRVTVTWKKVKRASGCQLKYGYKKSLKGAKTKSVKKGKTSAMLKNLKAGKTLYVKLRYKYKKGGKVKFSKFSKVKKVKLTKVTAVTLPAKKPVPANLDTTPKTFTMAEIQPTSRIIGRAVWQGESITAEWSGAGFEAGLICAGDISLEYSAEGGNGMLGVIIDEDYDSMKYIRFSAGENKAVIAQGLEAAYYTVRVVKLNEYDTNGVTFKKLTVGGILGDKPAEKSLKIEVIGDSLTAGYGNLYPATDGMNPEDFGYYEDAYSTHTAFAARQLDADFNIVAKSGFGIVYDCNGGNGILPPLWEKSLPRSGAAWDFSSYTPDIVVINLGTNDSNQTLNYISREAATEAVASFVGSIRAKYPACKIVWIEGMAGDYNLNLSKAIYDVMSETPDCKYLYVAAGSRGGWHSHPTAADNKKSGDDLVAFLKNQGWVK